MGKAAAGTPKAIANAIKAKGLGRLRWYCQICEKQCRDENGFMAHTRSEPHMRKMMLVGPKAGSVVAEYSNQFQKEFITLLRTRHLTNRVRANTVYNEYIQDKHHVHMNATRWVTLNGFVGTMGKAGIVKVDEDEKGLWIQWIDNSPSTLSKQASLQKRDRAQMDGEERERAELEAQIARAKAKDAGNEETDAGLQKKEGEKISLNLFSMAGPSAEAPTEASGSGSNSPPTKVEVEAPPAGGPSTTTTTGEIKPAISFGSISTPSMSTSQPISINSNPLKRPASTNVFKSAKAPKIDSDRSESGSSMGQMGKKGYMSEAERLMKEDQMRRMAKANGGYSGFGPKRTGDGGRRFVLQ